LIRGGESLLGWISAEDYKALKTVPVSAQAEAVVPQSEEKQEEDIAVSSDGTVPVADQAEAAVPQAEDNQEEDNAVSPDGVAHNVTRQAGLAIYSAAGLYETALCSGDKDVIYRRDAGDHRPGMISVVSSGGVQGYIHEEDGATLDPPMVAKRQQKIADHARNEQDMRALVTNLARTVAPVQASIDLEQILSEYRRDPPKAHTSTAAWAALDKRQADRVAKALEKSRAEAEQRELAKIFSQYPRCGPPKVNPAMAALDKRQADRVAKALADLDAKAEQRQAQSAEVNANSAETGSDSSPVHERNWRGLLHAVQQHVAQEEARQPGFSNTRVTDKGAQDVKDMIDQYISGSRRRLACL